jgi:hypothetical protein
MDVVYEDRKVTIKRRAEDLAMELVEGGLVTDDPVLAPVCEKLRPFQAKLGAVNRDLVGKGLAMVDVEEPFGDEEAAAKDCLVKLVDKLWGMRLMFGIL